MTTKQTQGRQIKRGKYGSVKTVVDGITFDSKKEAKRYGDLKMLQRAGEISYLKCQGVFEIKINGQKVCSYKADFTYLDKAGKEVAEDVKGFKTPVYRLKKKLVKAIYGIDIKEV